MQRLKRMGLEVGNEWERIESGEKTANSFENARSAPCFSIQLAFYTIS
jgi:hypothetical protein